MQIRKKEDQGIAEFKSTLVAFCLKIPSVLPPICSIRKCSFRRSPGGQYNAKAA